MSKKQQTEPFGLGALPDKKDRHDFRLAGIQAPIIELPEIFELEEKFLPKDQDGRGSCTANSTAHHKERQEEVPLSARFLFAKTKELEGNKNYGAYTRNVFQIIQKIGACEEKLYPEPDSKMNYETYLDWNLLNSEMYKNAEQHKAMTYWRVDSSPEAIKQAIYQNKNSVVISIPWYMSDNWPNNGLLVEAPLKKDYVGGHALEVCGWTKSYLKIKNSWGKSYGKDGYCYLPLGREIWDAWISLDIPKELAVDNRYGAKRTFATYLLEKALVAYWTGKLKRLPSTREISGGVYGHHDSSTIFYGVNGDVWLFKTKEQLLKEGFVYKYN